MTEKIVVEVDTKIFFEKKCKIQQKYFFNAFFTPSKNLVPNLKDFCLKFMKIVKKKNLPSTTND